MRIVVKYEIVILEKNSHSQFDEEYLFQAKLYILIVVYRCYLLLIFQQFVTSTHASSLFLNLGVLDNQVNILICSMNCAKTS
jgi:hypothetical protein